MKNRTFLLIAQKHTETKDGNYVKSMTNTVTNEISLFTRFTPVLSNFVKREKLTKKLHFGFFQYEDVELDNMCQYKKWSIKCHKNDPEEYLSLSQKLKISIFRF